MKELEDTKCEVRRTTDLQFSLWDRWNASSEEEGTTSSGSSGSNRGDSPRGNFFEEVNYAWLSSGPRLAVINAKTGVGVSSWTFRERITCVSQFPVQPGQIPLLLVGLDNGASKLRDSCGFVCVFDCTTSQVLRAIRTPAGVEQTCVITGGAEWEDFGGKGTDGVLGNSSGMACVALRNLDLVIIDLKRSSWDGATTTTLFDESNPAELDFTHHNGPTQSRQRSSREKHAAFNLMNSRLEKYIGFNREDFESSSMYEETLISSLICSRKIGCLVSGCLGRIIIWQTDGEIRWISGPLDESASLITHLALLEPADDPRPFCYLWSVHQEEDRGRTSAAPILRMHAMLFERKYTDKGTNSYFNLEADPSVKFEHELEENEKVTSLCPIVRDSNSEQTDSTCRRGEDSILLISTETRALLFDLNQWYKEQMPQTIGECNNQNAIVANYRTRSNTRITAMDEVIVNCAYSPETLKEFPSNSATPTEELFYPNSLSLEWIELSTARLTFWTTRGIQAELLREISMSGPVILIEPMETFARCVAAGLVSTGGDPGVETDRDLQRETLLSLCLEQRWSKFLLRCAREWSDGSASYLFHNFLRWGMQRASSIKLSADLLSVPLYDQSGAGIGEAEIKQLRFHCQQLECITNVVTNLRIDTVDLTNERRALRRVSTYLQVLLWFYDVDLLPETQEIEDDGAMPLSFSLKIPYPYEKLASMYREKRKEFARSSTKNTAEHEEDMFIDELVTRECKPLRAQWEREGSETSVGGYYPPSSLQSLLRSYLTDCHAGAADLDETENKHQITIYLLMDLAMLLQNSCPAVNQLIKYPSAFKLSPSLIKLTQAFWLLDHEDYHGFLEMMTGQLVSDSDVKDWHHKLVMRTLIRNNQNKLALIYLRVRKPPLSSIDDQSTVISLSVEHGLVQSAFHRRPPTHYAQLLTSFYCACKKHDKLNDILHLALDPEEEEVFVKFLENERTEDTRLLYYLQRCRYAEASNVFPIGSTRATSHSRTNERSTSLTIFNAYNATLPDVTRKFSSSIGTRSFNGDATSRYPRPMSHCKSRARAHDIHESVMRKARETFLRRDRSRIPFVSAPCASFRTRAENVDTNSVLYVERLERSRGKRSLDEMRGDDRGSVDHEDDRKRRKTAISAAKTEKERANDREIGSSMVFDTPLVKRKNQMISARSVAIETPHSILKIRQLIRDSTSPCHVDGTAQETIEQKLRDRERKRRQIRFSLGQSKPQNETAIEDIELSTDDNAGVLGNPDETRVTCDVAEIAESLGKDDVSEEEEEHAEETYYSPNVSEKSSCDATLLDEASGDVSINVSGPRPRPSLRRSNESNSSDLLKKTLKRTSSEGARIWCEKSFDEESKNNVLSTADKELLSSTAYTASILSSDTSFEQTLSTKSTLEHPRRESTFSFSEKSVEKCRDLSSMRMSTNEKSENFRKFSQAVTKLSSTRRSNVFEESTRDPYDDDKNSEVLMEVDGFGLDRESTNQSPMKSTWDVDNNLDRVESVEASTIRNIMDKTDSVEHENSLEPKEGSSETCPRLRVSESEDVEVKIREDDEAVGISDSEDGEADGIDVKKAREREPQAGIAGEEQEDELALRYEDNDDDEEEEDEIDNNEVYQSLSNSAEISESKSSSERSVVAIEQEDEKTTKSLTNNGFYEIPRISCQDANITDDESSQSVDGSLANANSIAANNDLEKTISVEKASLDIINEASNITNDDSSSSFDSSLFSVKKPRGKSSRMGNTLNDADKISNDDGTSQDSSLFSNKKKQTNLGDEGEINPLKVSGSVERIEDNSSNTCESQTSNATENDLSAIANDSADSSTVNATSVDIPLRCSRTKQTPGKSSSGTKLESPPKETEVSTPLRMTRSRRASSVVHEQSPMIESPVTRSSTSGRLRRASSLAKDFVATGAKSSVVTTPVKLEPKSARLRRSVSLATDLTPMKSRIFEDEGNQETEMEEAPIGRRTRRATSVQKETPAPKTTKPKKSSSKISLTEEPNTDEPSTSRKSTRAKRSTSGREEASDAPRRLTRASSLAKEPEDDRGNEDVNATVTRRTTRKRGNSLPKDISAETSARSLSLRTRRGSSSTKEIILDDASEHTEEAKSRRGASREKIESTKSASPTNPMIGTRNRLSSITSIPEEEEEDEDKNESDNELFTWSGKSKKTSKGTRLRRANSVDSASLAAIKRRTRTKTAKSAIIDEPIKEEDHDVETTSESKISTKKAPTVRRKRTTSATTSRDAPEEMDSDKTAPRRTRKTSAQSNESEVFRFSPPGKARDRPDRHSDGDDVHEDKGTSGVTDFVFSEPTTRSKQATPQPRRKVNRDFIPITETERAAGKRAMESFVSCRPSVKLSGQTRDPFLLYGPRKIFSFPKRSKSLTEDSTGSRPRDRKKR